jgi:hypothetical protein
MCRRCCGQNCGQGVCKAPVIMSRKVKWSTPFGSALAAAGRLYVARLVTSYVYHDHVSVLAGTKSRWDRNRTRTLRFWTSRRSVQTRLRLSSRSKCSFVVVSSPHAPCRRAMVSHYRLAGYVSPPRHWSACYTAPCAGMSDCLSPTDLGARN